MLGARLRRAREAMKFSLADVAREMGRSRQAVHQWEAGLSQPTAIQLGVLMRVYCTTADRLLSGSSEAAFSAQAAALAREYDLLPADLQRQWRLLWQVFAKHGAPDPAPRVG